MSNPSSERRTLRTLVTCACACACAWAIPLAAARAQGDGGVTELGASAGVHFLLVDSRIARTDTALRRVAHVTCIRDRVCAVRFWIAEAHAARALPMTDDEARHEFAAYAINRNTGQDDFTCRPSAARVPPCTSGN